MSAARVAPALSRQPARSTGAPGKVRLPAARAASVTAETILTLQRTAGNAAVVQLLSRHVARRQETALQVSDPNDRYEREAHAASAAVLAGRMPGLISSLPTQSSVTSTQRADKARAAYRAAVQHETRHAQRAVPHEEEKLTQRATALDEAKHAQRALMAQAAWEADEMPVHRLAQLLCQGCADAAGFVQRASAAAQPGLDTATAARMMASAGGGAPLEPALRQAMERSFGRDLSAVRVHTGAAAQRAAAAIKARAFTSGHNIFLGAGESPTNRALIAHELTHVVQQGATAMLLSRPVARFALSEPAPVAMAEAPAARARAPSAPALVQRDDDNILDKIGEALSPAAALDQALGLLPEPVARVVRSIHDQGILGYLGGLIQRGVSGILGGLADLSPTLGAAIDAIGGIGAQVSQILGALAGGDCGPLFAAMESLKTAISDAAGAAWDRITDFLRPVGDFLQDIWNRFGAPTIDWLKQAASDVWTEISDIAQTIWSATEPLRSTLGAAFGAAWSGIKHFIGIGDEGDSSGGLIGWVTDQANKAWSSIKALAEPVLEPISRVVARVQQVLPLGVILNLRATVQTWLEQVAATANTLGQPDTMNNEAGQATVRDTLLPALNNAIAGVKNGVQAAGGWVAGEIGGLAAGVTGMMDAVGRNPVLGALSGTLGWLSSGAERLGAWATAGVGAAFGVVNQGLDGLGGFARRGLDFFLNLAATVGDLAGQFGSFVLGRLWRAIPACIRDPVIDFLTNQILRRIPVFSQLMDVPDLWKRAAAVAMTIIRQVFIDGNLARAAWTFFSNLINLIGLPPDLITGIIARAATAMGDILRDPLGFLGNLLRAVKQGFSQFLGNGLQHLLNGVSGWLFGQAQRAGLTPPASLSLGEIFRFVLDVLGLGVDFIFERLGKAIGEKRANALRRGLEKVGQGLVWITDLITEGPASLWRHISGQLANLWDTVLDSVVTWVSEKVVSKAIQKLLTSLDPSGIGAVVNSLIAVYNAIESAVEYMRPMLEIIRSVLDGVGDIARGAIAGAASFVENSMARAVPIVVGFLANQVGLGDAGKRIGEMVEKLRARVAGAVDRLIQGAMGLLGKVGLFGKGSGGAAGGPKEKGAASPVAMSESFVMKTESHRLTVTATGGSVRIVMASREGNLSDRIDALIPKIEASNIRRKVRVINKLEEIRSLVNDPNKQLDAYAKSKGEEYTRLKPPPEFLRDYTHRLAGEVASLGRNYGFRDLVADAFLPDPLPAKRYIPEPVRGDIRKRLYERGSNWPAMRRRVVDNGVILIDTQIAEDIIAPRAAGRIAEAEAAMKAMKNQGKILEDAKLADFVPKVSYVTPRLARYAVDHDPSLAEHWAKSGGNQTTDAERRAVTEGKTISALDLVTARFNSSKSSRDLSGEVQRFKAHAWISPPFTSEIALNLSGAPNTVDAITIDTHSLTHADGTPFIPSN